MKFIISYPPLLVPIISPFPFRLPLHFLLLLLLRVLDEILLLVNTWEDKWFQEKDQTLGLPHPEGEMVLKRLAKEIVEKAREMSLDKNRDGPFALLAKENDIMWGGGMPDDTTVVVARVVKDQSI